jgi:nicotinamide phosphoribosyltransferase
MCCHICLGGRNYFGFAFMGDGRMHNLILDTDSYKASHYLQYPPGTTSMFAYLESRGGEYPQVLFFGLQYYLKEYLTQTITAKMVNEAQEFFHGHGEPFPYAGWMHIVNQCGGHFPIRIRAVPEGTMVPNSNILMSVESTDPEVFWIVGWLETLFVRLWYPCTVATRSHAIKQNILKYLQRSSDDPKNEILFKLHDFGSRGVSSQESAQIGGAAHLANFRGSDTVAGVWTANHFYNSPMSGFSIPAAEHSTITAWGRFGEAYAYRNMLQQFAKPGSLVAVVSDSYDLWNALEHIWGGSLRQEVIDSGATVVIRPDSGDPPSIVLKSLQLLESRFGTEINSKGFKVLNNVRVIQGDGINEDSIITILDTITQAGYSASNVNFGMGGGLLQQLNRDTQKFAFKCSAITRDGQMVYVHKNPITGPDKQSKSGRLDLRNNCTWQLQHLQLELPDSQMWTVFENGKILIEQSFDEIIARADNFQ